ncbi:hypothetical protein T492DRAFT_998323 [Pavlovales sp. CCMP2436]|nr:hypothetical protein T492DRAFT_998323 [Pavlovales sp. CCMP2436]
MLAVVRGVRLGHALAGHSASCLCARGVRLGRALTGHSTSRAMAGLPRAVLSLGLSVLSASAFYESTAERAQCDGAAHHELEPLLGVWLQIKPACESLCPFIEGLGMPGARYVCGIVDAVQVTLRISLADGDMCEIVDKTIFGRNSTRVQLGGGEVEAATRGGRKRYMLSGWRSEQNGVGIKCRLFQRGDGWETLMERRVMPDGRLEESNTLRRPGLPDVVVRRYFSKVGPLTEDSF